MKSHSVFGFVLSLVAAIEIGLPLAGCSKSVPPPDNSPLSEAEKQAPFLAVTRIGQFVLAATSNGLFRAQISTKQWQRISFPGKISVEFQFANSQTKSNWVFCCTSPGVEENSRLYLSQDEGASWKLKSNKYNFKEVYANSDGRLYAIAIKLFRLQQDGEMGSRWQILVSNDDGSSWEDITANIASGYQLFGIFPDPAFPKRVCVFGNCIRDYVCEPTDDHYTSWTLTREWDWHKNSRPDEDFLRGIYGSSTICYIFRATLQNYFDYDFESSSEIPAFTIEVDTNHLEFAAGEKIQLPITIKFHPDKLVVKFPDATNNLEFWFIRCIYPDGKRLAAAGGTNRIEQGRDLEILNQRMQDETSFRIVEISSEHPYSRRVSLNDLADFSKPGSYRLRLSYDSIGWGWESNKQSGIWGGEFSSPIFTLKIKQ